MHHGPAFAHHSHELFLSVIGASQNNINEQESKSIDNVKRGETEEESKLNAGCNHALALVILCAQTLVPRRKLF